MGHAINKNIILNPAQIRIMQDQQIKDLVGDVSISKGPKKPTGTPNPCFTAHILSHPPNPDTKAYNGTLQIKFFCDDYPSGNANVELIGEVEARIVDLFDDKPFEIDGYLNYDLHVDEPAGPYQGNEGEHYSEIRIKYSIVKLT